MVEKILISICRYNKCQEHNRIRFTYKSISRDKNKIIIIIIIENDKYGNDWNVKISFYENSRPQA